MHSSFRRGRTAACAGVVAAITTYGLALPASAAPPSPSGELTDIRHLSPAAAGLEDADRVAWSADLGRVVVAGGDGSSAVAVDLAEDDGDPVPAPPDAAVAEPEGAPVTAHNSEDGLTYSPDAEQGLLVGADESGTPVSAYTAGDVDLAGVRSMTFAPSTDPTDDAARRHLFLLSDSDGGEAVVTEAALTPASVRAAATRSARLVATIDTSTWSPTSPDPAGIAYDAERDRLLVTDSEVNETPHWAGVNYWETTRAGEVQATGLGGVRGGDAGGGWFNSADFSCRNQTVEVCVEPTGIDFDPRTGHIFVSNDDSDEVVEIDPGRDQRFGTRDDVQVSRVYLGGQKINADGEGVAVDTKRGVLLILGGTDAEVYRVAPGPDGSFGGTDNVVTSFDVARHGAIDPEGITYDAVRDRVAVVEHTTERIYEMSPVDGALLDVVDVAIDDSINMAGLTIAPRSDGSDERAYYIADRGVDNDQPPNADPDEDDGRIYEVAAGLGPLDGRRQGTLTSAVERLGGTDRIQTAVKASQTAWTAPDGAFPANAVVLARDDDYADAMVGAPLAAAVQGPLLLTDTDELSAATLAEMRRILKRETAIVYLVGGPGALSDTVARQVRERGRFSTVRIDGGDRLGMDRYGTAVAVADELRRITGRAPESVALASGTNYPDGLAAGASAGAFGQPVLLTYGDREVPASTKGYLDRHANATTVAVGGPAAATGQYDVELDGTDRYDTARKVAEHYFGDAPAADAPWLVGVATGLNWPDALTGGAFMATYGGPLLLTEQTGLSAAAKAAVTALQEGPRDVTHGAVFGSSSVVSETVRGQLETEVRR